MWAVWLRWRQGWAALPRECRDRWCRVVAGGLAANTLLMVLLVYVTRGLERAGRLEWEVALLRWIELESGLSFGYALVVQELGGPFLLSTLVFTGAVAALWAGRPLRAASFVAAFFFLNPVTLLGWELWERTRPAVVAAGIASPGGLHSFPSGHVAHATALYGLLFGLWIRGSPGWPERVLAGALFVAAISLIAMGRLRMGVHWPTDVLAGVAIGGFWLGVLLFALHRSEPDPPVLDPASPPAQP